MESDLLRALAQRAALTRDGLVTALRKEPEVVDALVRDAKGKGLVDTLRGSYPDATTWVEYHQLTPEGKAELRRQGGRTRTPQPLRLNGESKPLAACTAEDLEGLAAKTSPEKANTYSAIATELREAGVQTVGELDQERVEQLEQWLGRHFAGPDYVARALRGTRSVCGRRPVSRRLPQIVDRDDFDRLLAQPSRSAPTGVRNAAVLAAMYDTGLQIAGGHLPMLARRPQAPGR